MQVSTIVAPEHIVDMKVCIDCIDKTPKPVSEFNKHSSRRDGLKDRCKDCDKVRRSRYLKNYHRPQRMPILHQSGKKQCTDCKQEKLYSDFRKDSQTKDGLDYYCKACRKSKRLPQRRVWSNQVCDICGKPETVSNQYGVKSLAIDHCHITGKIRGLLCFNCNVGLGKFGDDPELLLKASIYLSQSREEAS